MRVIIFLFWTIFFMVSSVSFPFAQKQKEENSIIEGHDGYQHFKEQGDLHESLLMAGFAAKRTLLKKDILLCKKDSEADWGFFKVKNLLVHWVRFRCGFEGNRSWVRSSFRVVPGRFLLALSKDIQKLFGFLIAMQAWQVFSRDFYPVKASKIIMKYLRVFKGRVYGSVASLKKNSLKPLQYSRWVHERRFYILNQGKLLDGALVMWAHKKLIATENSYFLKAAMNIQMSIKSKRHYFAYSSNGKWQMEIWLAGLAREIVSASGYPSGKEYKKYHNQTILFAAKLAKKVTRLALPRNKKYSIAKEQSFRDWVFGIISWWGTKWIVAFIAFFVFVLLSVHFFRKRAVKKKVELQHQKERRVHADMIAAYIKEGQRLATKKFQREKKSLEVLIDRYLDSCGKLHLGSTYCNTLHGFKDICAKTRSLSEVHALRSNLVDWTEREYAPARKKISDLEQKNIQRKDFKKYAEYIKDIQGSILHLSSGYRRDQLSSLFQELLLSISKDIIKNRLKRWERHKETLNRFKHEHQL